ncbi:MAG: PAS domain-containing sensor histidine kinase [Anaerolineae bacterium]|nr:PAS domain-containing sensor histidine kinase [Anaerolineae bacterium]
MWIENLLPPLLLLVFVSLAALLLYGLVRYSRTRPQPKIEFRYLLDGMTDGVWFVDTEARTTFVNPQLTRLFQLTEQDMLGKTIFDLMVPEQVEATRQAFARRLEGEKATGITTLTLRNGVTLHLRFNTVPIYDRRKRLTGALGILSDVSENYHMEQQLRQEEEHHRLILENINDIIYVIGPNGIIESLNPAFTRITGWEVEDWLGRPGIDLIYPDDRDKFTQSLQEAIMPTRTIEARLRTVSDQPIHVEIKSHRIIKDGVNLGSTGVARDITTRKTEALQDLQVLLEYERLALLNRFIRHASHDLRTPLSIMNSSAYLVRRKLPTDALVEVQRHLETIEQQVMHLNEQLDNLFAVSKDYMLSRVPFVEHNFHELVTLVVRELAPVFDRKNQSLIFTGSDTDTLIHCNPEEIRLAVRHILINASSYTLPNGKINLELTRNHESVTLKVQDNGIGIEPEDQEHIFEAFYRVDEARSLDTGGMGLGLTITRAIVEAHGAQIKLESVPDQGTTVTLVFPVHQAALQPASTP